MRILAKGMVLIAVPLVLSAVITTCLYGLLLETDREREIECRNSRAVEPSIAATFSLFDLGSALADFIMKPRERAANKERFKRDLETVRSAEEAVLELDVNPGFATVIRNERNQLQYILEGAAQIFRDLRKQPLSAMMRATEFKLQTTELAYSLLSTTQALINDVLGALKERPAEERKLFLLQLAVLAVGTLASALVGLATARWFIHEIVMRLKTMIANTARLTRGEQLNPPISGADEIAFLDQNFHRMASELAAAKRKEQQLFEDASDVIAVLNEDFTFTALNPASYSVLGFTPSTLVGTSAIELLHDDDKQEAERLLCQVMGNAEPLVFRNRVKHAGGGYVDFEWSVCWSDSNRELCAVAHDVSEEKRIEQKKAEFLSVVSHDVRTPLCSFSALFEMISSQEFGHVPDGVKSAALAARARVDALVQLVNDLLDVEKFAASKMSLTRKLADLEPIADRAVSDIEEAADRKNISIAVDSAALNQKVLIDVSRMTQALSNLIATAVANASEKSVVLVQIGSLDEASRVEITFRMTDADRQPMLDWLNGTTSSAEDAVIDLRLQLSRRIIEAHGGRLTASALTPDNITMVVELAEDAPTKTTTQERKQPEKVTQHGSQTSSSRRRLLGKGLAVVAVPILFQITIWLWLVGLLVQSHNAKQMELERRIVATTAHNSVLLYYKLAMELNLPKSPELWKRFAKTMEEAGDSERQLQQLTTANPQANQLAKEISAKLTPVHAFFAKAKAHVAQYGSSAEVLDVAMDHHRGELDRLPVEVEPIYQRLLQTYPSHGPDEDPDHLAELRKMQGLLLLGSFLCSVVLSAVAAAIFSKHVTKRLQVMSDNMERLKTGRPLNAVVAGNDELTALDEYFHSMEQALREAELRVASVFDNSQDTLCILDRDGNIKAINPSCYRMWKYSPDELSGRNIIALLAGNEKQRFDKTLRDLTTDHPHENFEVVVTAKNGTTQHVSWSLSRAAHGDDIVGIAHDITQSMALREMKAKFVQMIGTRMRAPVEEIRNTAREISSGSLGAVSRDVAERLASVDFGCARLLRLIDNLSTNDRTENESSHQGTRFTASELFEETRNAVDAFAQSKGIKLSIAKNDDHVMYGDLDKLSRVCVNLVSNAIKFSSASSVVQVYSVIDGVFVRICVNDEGRGIPASEQSRIFEKFAQVQIEDGERSAGTGLGLPICKTIVESYGGAITVTSEEGKGSMFCFTVPIDSRSIAADGKFEYAIKE